jgi:hypothetical protein
MKIQTLEELQRADDRSLSFTPMGLGHMPAADAADFQQRVVAKIDLSVDVAAATKGAFDRLRTVFAHGVLCYEAYTLVHDHALLIVEQALRDRFMQHYSNAVTFIDKRGATIRVEADNYETVFQAGRGKRLVVGDSGPHMPFKGMLPDLSTWARRLGYFRGQRNRHQEGHHGKLRNLVAHASPHLTSPVEAAEELRAAAEVINQLWGHPTSSGRYYPGRRPRQILALGWSESGGIQLVDAHLIGTEPDVHTDWLYIIVKAVADDPYLFEFHSRYEMTAYPTEWIWGPGTVEAAAVWMKTTEPASDDRDHLDRTFAIRFHDGYLYAPQRPELALQAGPADRQGEWFIVRADHPSDARVHIRNRVTSQHCQETGPCENCFADLLAAGSYKDVYETLKVRSPQPLDQLPPLVATPSAAEIRVKVL